MATSSATRNALPTRRTRKARASAGQEVVPPASDGEEEGATQANQAEVEKVAEDIKNKLGELTDPNTDLDQVSRDFLAKIAADKDTVMARLDEAKASIRKDKASSDALLIQLLGKALAPASAELSAASPEYTTPLSILQVNAKGQLLHEQTVRLLKQFEALFQEYHDLNTNGSGESPIDTAMNKFNTDSEYIEGVFAAGRKAGKRAVENMLADRCNEVRERTPVSDVEKELAQLLWPPDRKEEDVTMEDFEGWGASLTRLVARPRRWWSRIGSEGVSSAVQKRVGGMRI